MEPALIVSAVFSLIDLAIKFRANLKQSSDWTPEQEAEFSKRIIQAYAEPHWQPSDKPPEPVP